VPRINCRSFSLSQPNSPGSGVALKLMCIDRCALNGCVTGRNPISSVKNPTRSKHSHSDPPVMF
jgi:hypothetical protein